ncbi:hypothetical protein TYRP_006887 [Tyrophagus putrescentiae]|nr:hypothetical protein TYRP_006887 [Tyrophagus putrescentiae]
MRLSPVTTIKSRHLFPASKMSLVKVHSNEKLHLNLGGSVDLKAILPLGLEECCLAQAGKMATFGRALYAATEDHRRRLMATLAKSWLRLVLSALVLLAQFAWFTAHFSGDGLFFASQPVVPLVLESQLMMNYDDQPPSHLFESSSPSSAIVIRSNNFSEEEGNDKGDHRLFDAPEEKLTIFSARPSSTSFSSSSSLPKPSFTDRLLSLLWKIFSLIKLALVLVLFELLRFSDTLVNVIRQLKDEDEERNRAPPKSPVDTGYIERNRGYK